MFLWHLFWPKEQEKKICWFHTLNFNSGQVFFVLHKTFQLVHTEKKCHYFNRELSSTQNYSQLFFFSVVQTELFFSWVPHINYFFSLTSLNLTQKFSLFYTYKKLNFNLFHSHWTTQEKQKTCFYFFVFSLCSNKGFVLSEKTLIFFWLDSTQEKKKNLIGSFLFFLVKKKKKLKSEVKLFPHGSKYIKIYKYIFWSGILFSKSKYFLANSSVLRQN